MKIGIDVSQLAYPNTGVANYLKNLVENLVRLDLENEYILFFSSLRKEFSLSWFNFPTGRSVSYSAYKIPPTILSFLWNNLHVLPIEQLIGDVDLFITSDWAEPPTKRAKKITIVYDLIVYKYPEETHNQTQLSFRKMSISSNIVSIQKKKLSWVKKESAKILCISKSTMNDVHEILGIEKDRLAVIYPGFTL